MKKLLGIVVLGLLWSTYGQAGSNKITIDRCFDPETYQNYNLAIKDPNLPLQEWILEIDLKNNKASRITQFKHESKVTVDPFEIVVATSKFVQIKEKYGLKSKYTINLRTGILQIETKHEGKPVLIKCEKFN